MVNFESRLPSPIYRETSPKCSYWYQKCVRTKGGTNSPVEHSGWKTGLPIQSVSMGLTDRRKTAKNLADSRKNGKTFTVSRKQGKKELTVKESVP